MKEKNVILKLKLLDSFIARIDLYKNMLNEKWGT